MRSDRVRRDVPAGASVNHQRHRPNLEDASGGNRGKPNLTIRSVASSASERTSSDREIRPLTEEQRELAIKYLPMARGLAQRLYPTSPAHPEELQSTAYLALVDAARTFDPTRNVGFGGFARHRIRARSVIFNVSSKLITAARVFRRSPLFEERVNRAASRAALFLRCTRRLWCVTRSIRRKPSNSGWPACPRRKPWLAVSCISMA